MGVGKQLSGLWCQVSGKPAAKGCQPITEG
jgi:hypothetical protein